LPKPGFRLLPLSSASANLSLWPPVRSPRVCITMRTVSAVYSLREYALAGGLMSYGATINRGSIGWQQGARQAGNQSFGIDIIREGHGRRLLSVGCSDRVRRY